MIPLLKIKTKRSLWFTVIITLICPAKFTACRKITDTKDVIITPAAEVTVVKDSNFQSILDHSLLKGAILLYQPDINTYYTNDINLCKDRKLPASTFKIPHTIIGLESNNLSDTTIFKWDGQKRMFSFWEQDHTLAEAFKRSCLPCYQELANKIGTDTMNYYLDKIFYPGMNVDSSTINNFWVFGNSGISIMEQITFLVRFFNRALPISRKTQSIVENIMLEDNNQGYKIWAKTGWSFNPNGKDNGWYVGRLIKGNRVFYFATNIEPLPGFNMESFARTRKEITLQAFRTRSIID